MVKLAGMPESDCPPGSGIHGSDLAAARSITEVLAIFILHGKAPLKCVAIAGEVIAIDSRFCDYDGARTRCATGEQLGAVLETYEVLLQQTHSSIVDCSRTRDWRALVEALSEIKMKLNAFL